METIDCTFEVHPSVIFKLGEDLITDDYQALSELAKNSYDADACKVIITIDTVHYFKVENGLVVESQSTETNSHLGMIKIEDDGTGMTVEDIICGWLTISSSKKREMKSEGRKTQKGRTPLGDKGLGRLGTQRLGPVLEMATKTEEAQATGVLIDWRRFQSDDPLSKIPITIRKIETFPRRKGTTLKIIGLSEPEEWQDTKALQVRFADIISPYTDELGLKVSIRVNGKKVDLREQSTLLVKSSLLSYSLKYLNKIFFVEGFVSTRYLANLGQEKKRAVWEELIEEDGGRGFFEWLLKKRGKALEPFSIKFDDEIKDRLCNFSFSFEASAIDKIEVDCNGDFLDPGPFEGRIDFLPRRRTPKDPFPTEGPLKPLLDAMSGVKVFRDGFGIPVGEVIPFASQWSSGGSWYTLRPDNVVGYINISAEGNSQLVETTNREAFKENGYYRNFQQVLSGWLNRAGDLQEAIRRGYNAYVQEWEHDRAQIEKSQNPIAVAAAAADAIEGANRLLKNDVSPHNEAERSRIVSTLETTRFKVEVLAKQVQEAQESLNDAWELAGLGIMAETVSHEAFNLIDHIIHEAQKIRRVNNGSEKNPTIESSASMIVSMANAMRKQISHLNDSLRYVRNRKDVFSVISLLDEVKEYMDPRFKKNGIELEIQGSDYLVRMNKGRLIQVIDNLLLNSEYWLLEDARRGRCDRKLISISLDKPLMKIKDNGSGIEESVEATLFDPFVTRKKAGEGRGLGLYIVKMLLAAEDCNVRLSRKRNDNGRRYCFVIDLSKVVE